MLDLSQSREEIVTKGMMRSIFTLSVHTTLPGTISTRYKEHIRSLYNRDELDSNQAGGPNHPDYRDVHFEDSQSR